MQYRKGLSSTRRIVGIGVFVFTFLLIYDGALRKWLFPGAEKLIFLSKDFLLFFLLIYVLSKRRRFRNSEIMPESKAFFILYAWWVLLEVANFNIPNFFVGIWGLKAHLLYASLILLIPLAFRNLDDLFRRLVQIYPWIVLPVCTLTFVQLGAEPDSFINRQVTGGLEMISYFGEANLVRVTGTFSYISGMASFVQVISVLGIGLFLGGARSKSFLLGLGFAMASLPVTGSRSVIAVAGVSAIMMLFVARTSRLISPTVVWRAIATIGILGWISLQTQDATWVALQQRSQAAAESHNDMGRVFTAFTNAFDYFDAAGFLGFGTGSANLGAAGLVSDIKPFSWLPIGDRFEEESGRIVLELGIFGWLTSLAMRAAFFIWAVKLLRVGHLHSVRLAAVIALPVMALGVQQGSGVFATPIGAAFYWFCVALLSMAHYEQRQNRLHPKSTGSAFLQPVIGK
jgi:hypothetical protein